MILANALRWSVLAEIASKAIQPLAFLVLIRLLTPEDYGVVAAATIVVSFSQMFWEAGMAKALIQYRGDLAEAANVGFWMNLALALLVAGTLFLSADGLARWVFQDDRVAAVLRVLTLQIILGALGSVQAALLQRRMEFRQLFWVRLASVFASGIASIPLAWTGCGYWALVAGTLLGQAVQVVLLWQLSHFRPESRFRANTARTLLRFGAWVAATGLLTWSYIWGDSLVVGLVLGAHELGLYRTGNGFVLMIFGTLFGPVLPVLYSHFSQHQGATEKLEALLLRAIQIFTAVGIPVGVMVFSLSRPIESLIFGTQWNGIAAVIAVTAMVSGFGWAFSATGEFYRAIGRPHYETAILAATCPIYLLIYAIAAGHGLDAMLMMRLVLGLLDALIHFCIICLVKRQLFRPILATVGYAIVSSGCIALWLYGMLHSPEPSGWRLALFIAGPVIVITLALVVGIGTNRAMTIGHRRSPTRVRQTSDQNPALEVANRNDLPLAQAPASV
jgi:PST family polysaccharide transporter